jgi:integrase
MTRKRTATRLHLFTVREVQTSPDGDHSDGGGLLLRVRGESASWVLRYTAPTGRRREMGLGVARRGSLAQAGDSLTIARKLARDARDQLQAGVDPIDSRERERETAKQAEQQSKAQKKREHVTLARAARSYHERAIEPRLTSKHAAQWIASLENHVPAEVWHRPLADIDAPVLLEALSKVRSLESARERVPETLQRIRQRLDAVFEDAIFHGLCAGNPAAAIRRKMRETLPMKKAGEFKALDYRLAPAFMVKLREAEGMSARCLEFAVLTAARTTEALTAEWPEIDAGAAVWIVPAHKMKAKEAHVVHLSPRALAILAGQRGLDERMVFPSTMKPGVPMSNMALLATLDRLGVREQTTVHGLCRATFSTWANETGAARPDVIEACLAHREADRVKAAYNRSKFTEERRALMDAWSSFLANPQSNVIPLRAA